MLNEEAIVKMIYEESFTFKKEIAKTVAISKK